MKRTVTVVSLILLGVVLLGFAVAIELDIHAKLENAHMAGFRRFIVRRWPDKREQVRHYRQFARIFAIAGPIALAGAYVIAFGWKKPDLSRAKRP